MFNLKQAAQMALEFCEFLWRDVAMNDYASEKRQAVEDALRAALSAVQEPVADALLLEAVRHAEWQDKHIHPYSGETFQNWRVTVYLPVPLSEPDKSPEAALARAVNRAHGIGGSNV
jgi:hypothetical protein